MDKLVIYAVMGRGHVVVNCSKGIELFSGTLEKCENFIRCHI